MELIAASIDDIRLLEHLLGRTCHTGEPRRSPRADETVANNRWKVACSLACGGKLHVNEKVRHELVSSSRKRQEVLDQTPSREFCGLLSYETGVSFSLPINEI
jgi:hypothetical protein